VTEASYANIPIVAFCNIDSPTKVTGSRTLFIRIYVKVRCRVLVRENLYRGVDVKVSRSKVVLSFFIDDIFYVVIVFKIHEIIYLRMRQYITGDIL
jgi:hypothetical protein